MIEVSKRIKKLRERDGLSQKDIAKAVGISRSAVSEIEAGSRRIYAEELVNLARAFSVSVDFLLGLVNETKIHLEGRPKRKKKHKELRINVPQRNIEKFREVLLYILDKVGAKSNIGETVIYKLLYFIDFDYYEKYEEQLIGATYLKNHYGPTPVEFRDIVDKMIKDRDLVKIYKPYFEYQQKKYLPLRAADLSKLSGREIELINDVLNRLSEMNAAQVSDHSHGDMPWQTAEDGDVINYEAVFYRTLAYSVRSYEGDDVP